jgi:hypothetical protein
MKVTLKEVLFINYLFTKNNRKKEEKGKEEIEKEKNCSEGGFIY